MRKEVVFGPPGTGKTTYLMRLLREKLTHTPAEKIAFVSFTRQGTYEGVSRAIDEFELTQDQTRYFKTIHSICFKELGVHRSMMIHKDHYKMFSDKTGIHFTGYYMDDLPSTNDAYLHYISMRNHNPKFAEERARELNGKTLKYVAFQYEGLKRQLGIYDYDDLLLKYLKHGTSLDVEVALIDEAQDLTPLQWRVVRKLFANAQQIYVAGDDDQAVYEWTGANVNEFLNFSKQQIVLDQSYRLPRNVLALANNVSKDIKGRKRKEFKAKDAEGVIQNIKDIKDIDYRGGELVLARTNWVLKELSKDFAALGIPYTLKGKSSVDRPTMRAIKAHIEFEKDNLSVNEMARYKSYFIDAHLYWQQGVDLPKDKIQHYEGVINNGNEAIEPVKFETFHSCKGSENDHVIISSDLSKRAHSSMFKRFDSELRCLYVAMTRTKSDLSFLMPTGKHFYPRRYF